MKKIVIITVLFSLLTLVFSCQMDSLDPDKKRPTGSFKISFKYRNVDGITPEIELVTNDTSPEVSFTKSSVSKDGAAVLIKFENLSINNEKTNYLIKNSSDIYCQYLEDGKWVTDVEFSTELKVQNKIAVVLVLDKSQSITPENLKKIQASARNFIDIVYSNNSSAEIGLVSFSSNNQIDFLSVNSKDSKYSLNNSYYKKSHYQHLNDHINGMTQGEFTALLDGINKAYSLIDIDKYEGCAIVSFTDGSENNSLTVTQANLIKKLKSSDKLKSFTIGFGDVKDSELQALAVNGQYEKADSISALQTVFNTFSKTVSTFHNVTLRRSSGIITDWVTMKLILDAK